MLSLSHANDTCTIAIWMMQAPGPRSYDRVLFRNAVYAAIE
jgi:hypothetical protein